MLGHTNRLEHLAAHGEVDVVLDTFPHTGGVTTVEALLMGVPVVTLLGEGVAGRLSASFLTALGLEDLVAETPDAYVSVARRLAGDLDRLTTERTTLRERLLASPIGEAQAYTRAVEAAYRDLWCRWCDLTPLSAPERGVTSGGRVGLGPGRARTEGGAGRPGLGHERVGIGGAGRPGLGHERIDTWEPAPTRPPAVGAGFKQPIPGKSQLQPARVPRPPIPASPDPDLPRISPTARLGESQP